MEPHSTKTSRAVADPELCYRCRVEARSENVLELILKNKLSNLFVFDKKWGLCPPPPPKPIP